jgi:ribosomally synthesized peptide (two-chain TOMM family)
MTTNNLLTFRTVFLRAVAQAWTDEKFKSLLLRDAPAAMLAYFNFKWPWPNACELKVLHSNDEFNWLHSQWVWSEALNEDLTMYAPLDPFRNSGVSVQQQAMALADYYRERPSIFGDDWGNKDNPNEPSKENESSANVKLASSADGGVIVGGAIGDNTPLGAGGLVPSTDDFTAFKVALLAAIAKAWHDDQFREILQVDANVALTSIRGYKLPWKLTLRVKDDALARWHPPGDLAHPDKHQSYWTFHKKNLLTLYLPTKPADVRSEPVALAVYNATGAEYPFTCTC